MLMKMKWIVPGLLLTAQVSHAFLNRLPIFNQCFYSSSMTGSLPDKKIVLTFDDGPNSQTKRLLGILDKHNVKATFFMLGYKAANNTTMVKEIWHKGHIIANHSYNHPNFHNLYAGGVKEQILKTDKILSPFMKEKFFRYPFGNSTCSAEEALASADYIKVGWQVDTCDYVYSDGHVTDNEAKICGIAPTNRSSLAAHTLQLIERKKGGIVLFHDIHRTTVDAMDEVISELIKRGYQFVNLDDADVLSVLKGASEVSSQSEAARPESRQQPGNSGTDYYAY